MKKSRKVGISIGIAVCAVVAVIGIAVAGMKDEKKEALEGLKDFFTITDDSLVNTYLEIDDFDDIFYEKDMSFTGELYTDVAGNTVKAEAEGIVDKSQKLISGNLNVGLGGMPFATFQEYSNDTSIYATSEIFGDRVLKLDYKENLYDLGAQAGIGRRNVMMLQKGYIEVFHHMVSDSPYERWEEILENEAVKKKLQTVYDTMTVEKKKNKEQEDGFTYYISLKAPEITDFIETIRKEYPKLEEQGYLEIIEKFISKENGIEIQEKVNKEKTVEEVNIYNAEDGYKMNLGRHEQEKDGHSGFDGRYFVDIIHGEEVILGAEMNCSYNAEESRLEIKGKEAQNQVEVSLVGKLYTDKKKGEISMDIQELTGIWKNRDITINGNVALTFGEYETKLPVGAEFNLLQKEEQELNQLGEDVTTEVENILGLEKYYQLLDKLGIKVR